MGAATVATVYILEIEEDEAGVYLRETGITGDFDGMPIHANCVDVPLLTIGTHIIEAARMSLIKFSSSRAMQIAQAVKTSPMRCRGTG